MQVPQAQDRGRSAHSLGLLLVSTRRLKMSTHISGRFETSPIDERGASASGLSRRQRAHLYCRRNRAIQEQFANTAVGGR